MKKIFLFLCGVFVVGAVFAQGQVNFSGRVAGLYDAPVLFFGDRLSGPGYLVQLYAGVSQGSLSPVGEAIPLRSGEGRGYWSAAARTIPASAIAADGTSVVQVRAWNVLAGATYEAAVQSGGGFGASNIITVKPTVAPDLPAFLAGLSSVSILLLPSERCLYFPDECPEPSTFALAALGGLVLFFRQRQ
ncbi:MAG: PEP-CTERM sorting domain-containing protein [Verrucomicrobia bacterium]|nr:PEP-CTERM sorting domain-containing protein [Verrucomicrobiota bacterium]